LSQNSGVVPRALESSQAISTVMESLLAFAVA